MKPTLTSKCVLCGDMGVGKTSMIQSYKLKHFSDSTTTTIGAEFCSIDIDFTNIHYRIHVWDTAGQERFRCMMPLYYRSADVVIIVTDSSNFNIINRIDYWIEYIRNETDCSIIIAVNKIDLLLESEITTLNDKLDSYRLNGIPIELMSNKIPTSLNQFFKQSLLNVVKLKRSISTQLITDNESMTMNVDLNDNNIDQNDRQWGLLSFIGQC